MTTDKEIIESEFGCSLDEIQKQDAFDYWLNFSFTGREEFKKLEKLMQLARKDQDQKTRHGVIDELRKEAFTIRDGSRKCRVCGDIKALKNKKEVGK